MRLAGVSAGNYRSFVDDTSLELRPLTLLFGYNSAGKSAALRVLPIVATSTDPKQLAPLALDSDAARGASFKDLLSRQSSSPTLRLGFAFADENTPGLNLQFEIRDLPDRQSQIIERLNVRDLAARGAPFVEALWDTQAPKSATNSHRYEFKVDGVSAGTFPMSMAGLIFQPPEGQPFSDILKRSSEALRHACEGVYWLNSLRAVPPRAARFGTPPRRMNADGSNAGDYLAHDSLAAGELVRDTSSWFEQTTGHRLAVRRYAVAGEEQYSIVINPIGAAGHVEVPVVDTGEGMAQVLPVIVLGCLARLGRLGSEPLLAVEHPELHLHPAAHARLAEFFCSVVRSAPKSTLVVETHSENFLLRVQIAIASGEISLNDVVVHWIRALDDGRSVADTITFDAAARPQGAGWPPGVFAEDIEQAKALLRIRKEKGM